MSVSFLRREPADSLHTPLARCYAYLYVKMHGTGDGDVTEQVARFEAMRLHDASLPRTHALYRIFGDDCWRDVFDQPAANLPPHELPFDSLKTLLRYLRVHTPLLDSKADCSETKLSSILERDRGWFVTIANIVGLDLDAVLDFMRPVLPLFSEVMMGHSYQSSDHYHVLLVSPWPMYKRGLRQLLRGLYPQSLSAVRSVQRTRNYLLRQSLSVEVYRAEYVTYIPDDLIEEGNAPMIGFYNLPRYAMPAARYLLPLQIFNCESSAVVLADKTEAALEILKQLLGPKGVYTGGEYLDQAVSTVDGAFPCALIHLKISKSTYLPFSRIGTARSPVCPALRPSA